MGWSGYLLRREKSNFLPSYQVVKKYCIIATGVPILRTVRMI